MLTVEANKGRSARKRRRKIVRSPMPVSAPVASSSPSVRQGKSASIWVSWEVILFFLLLLPAGFMFTSQSALFGFGILMWVVGVFGSVYCVVRRLWGPKAAKLAVLVLVLILLWELFSGKGRENSHDPFDRRDY